jgi:hypothetical protein
VTKRANILFACFAIAGAVAASAGGALRNAPPYLSPTPSKNLTVLVVITDRGISTTAFRQLGAGTQGTLETLKGPLPAGNLVTFNVYNRGKGRHDFKIFGKKTAAIPPGKIAHLYFKLGGAGKFAYQSTLDKSAAFRGFLLVR